MKKFTMRKNSLVDGAFIVTLGIIISKLLGVFYVIPFHSIIGDRGGALYGYAYTIYLFFMSIATAGIPLAISNLVSEYQAMGYNNIKLRVFNLGKKLSLFFGFIIFIFIFLLAPFFSKCIIGDAQGGNSLKDITFVIRVISTAILFVPLLSVYRGYYQGHRFMSQPSVSQIIEQIVRVIVIVFGSFLGLKIFHFSLAFSVGIALFGATLGAFVSFLYLYLNRKKNINAFNKKIRNVNEPIVSDKKIIKKIFYYAIPFILIDVFKSAYNYVDMFTVVKGLVNVSNFSVNDAEAIYSILSTWGAKFNMIVVAISSGVIVNVIPILTEAIVKKKNKDINRIIVQSLEIILFFSIPITLGISFLSKPIWMLFYGNSIYGANVLSFYIFVGLFISLFTAIVSILQTFKDYKGVFISLVSGLLLKILLNNHLMLSFHNMSFPSYYGVICASILGFLLSFLICLFILIFKYHISFEKSIHHFFDILCGSLIMIFVLFILKIFLPIFSPNRFFNIIIIALYGILGCVIYLFYTSRVGLIRHIFRKTNLSFKVKV